MNSLETIEELRAELLGQLEQVQSEEVLRKIKAYLDSLSAPKDFWDELTEFQKAEIHKGLAELKAGQKIPLAEVMRSLGR